MAFPFSHKHGVLILIFNIIPLSNASSGKTGDIKLLKLQLGLHLISQEELDLILMFVLEIHHFVQT